MRVIEDSSKEVFSARCPNCWSLLAFSRSDVHPPNATVRINEGRYVGSTSAFAVCPKCKSPISDYLFYDLDGVRKITE